MIEMRRAALVAIGFGSAVVFATGALAADAVQPIPVVSPAAMAAPDVAAMVEVFGGFDFHKMGLVDAPDCQGCHNTGLGFGGEGRAAIMLSPSFSMQMNVWAEHWSGRSTFDGECIEECPTWSSTRQGVGTHLTFNSGDFQFGGFASLGTRNPSFFCCDLTFANAGIEAVYNASQFRLYGQAGHTIALAPVGVRQFWADESVREYYGRLVGTYYPQPNIALSANVGVEMITYSSDWRGRLLTWGARTEVQPAGKPIYFFGSYQAGHNVYPIEFRQVEHVVRLGFGINVGSPDVQSRDRAVGLADYNCTFGVLSAPTCLSGAQL